MFYAILFLRSSIILCLKFVLDNFGMIANEDNTIIKVENSCDICYLEDNRFLVLCKCDTNPVNIFQINEDKLKIEQLESEICSTFNSSNEFLTSIGESNNIFV